MWFEAKPGPKLSINIPLIDQNFQLKPWYTLKYDFILKTHWNFGMKHQDDKTNQK